MLELSEPERRENLALSVSDVTKPGSDGMVRASSVPAPSVILGADFEAGVRGKCNRRAVAPTQTLQLPQVFAGYELILCELPQACRRLQRGIPSKCYKDFPEGSNFHRAFPAKSDHPRSSTRTSMTLVPVSPVRSRSPVASKKWYASCRVR